MITIYKPNRPNHGLTAQPWPQQRSPALGQVATCILLQEQRDEDSAPHKAEAGHAAAERNSSALGVLRRC